MGLRGGMRSTSEEDEEYGCCGGYAESMVGVIDRREADDPVIKRKKHLNLVKIDERLRSREPTGAEEL